ncbi:unnamed protein product [Effrenium voratum]|nr:unnamed protein product [Effrenium voratum]CAJ1460699.1 unnamed protein product [Effrenium voratum]|mmetsp:Transcript_27373/g.65078  ORF Transcript_27373/g.65078 Transcript_27373/m.65078 type:complete len:202 (+) Transcript_27373:56-661(+)
MHLEESKEEFSLGVTQLLDDLLKNQEGSPSPRPADDAMRQTFQRTHEFCEEAQKYMDLVAQEESDLKREAEQKRKKAERRWGMGETSGSNVFNGSQDSFFAVQENEARLAQVHQDIVDMMESKGPRIPVPAKDSPDSLGQTMDFHSSLGCTYTGDDDASPILDFERLLAHCEKMQAELEQWGDQRNSPRGWHSLDAENSGR